MFQFKERVTKKKKNSGGVVALPVKVANTSHDKTLFSDVYNFAKL